MYCLCYSHVMLQVIRICMMHGAVVLRGALRGALGAGCLCSPWCSLWLRSLCSCSCSVRVQLFVLVQLFVFVFWSCSSRLDDVRRSVPFKIMDFPAFSGRRIMDSPAFSGSGRR